MYDNFLRLHNPQNKTIQNMIYVSLNDKIHKMIDEKNNKIIRLCKNIINVPIDNQNNIFISKFNNILLRTNFYFFCKISFLFKVISKYTLLYELKPYIYNYSIFITNLLGNENIVIREQHINYFIDLLYKTKKLYLKNNMYFKKIYYK
jgi:hypothetical protein